MTGSLDRERVLELFDELSRELRWSKTRAQIYVVGGAAMALAFARERTTVDVDARIEKGHSALTDAVRKLGRKYDLGDTWLNEQATSAMPRAEDRGGAALYSSPFLTVTAASAPHLLAMKLLAARETDRADILTLVERLDLNDPAEAVAIYTRLFPAEPLKARARELLAEAFRAKGKPQAGNAVTEAAGISGSGPDGEHAD